MVGGKDGGREGGRKGKRNRRILRKDVGGCRKENRRKNGEERKTGKEKTERKIEKDQ